MNATTATRGSVRVETGSKRVRAYLGAEVVADTTAPLLVWERPYYPAYYFPLADVHAELLESDEVIRSPSRGDGRTFTIRAGGKEAPGAAVRYYLPKPHVRMDLLTPTDSATHCPYKGRAEYWSVRAGDGVHEDLAWSYATPLPESQKITGLVCFYNEKVDIYLDGVPQDRPSTKFS